jgi:WG containing repeat
MLYCDSVADMHARTLGKFMTVHRLVTVAAAVLCVCALVIAGCGSSGASGLHPVSVEGKWGYIDKTGAIKIQPQFDGARDFSDGLAMVSVAYKWGYIDTPPAPW